MANSRYDNIKYYDGSWKIPNEILVYNGSSWTTLGTKNSHSLKKLNVYNSGFICVTYYRKDVNIPKSIQIGKNKYAEILNSSNDYARQDNYNAGYVWEMIVSATAKTSLYTAYTKNQGDITNQAYINYFLEVSNGRVRLNYTSRFHGISIGTRKFTDATTVKYTDYAWNTGDKVRIKVSRQSQNGTVKMEVFNMNGTLLTTKSISGDCNFASAKVYNHYIGATTSNDNGGQTTYGNANVYSFSFTPSPTRSNKFTIDVANAANNVTTIQSSGGFGGKLVCKGTKVYGASYTEYIRQTI